MPALSMFYGIIVRMQSEKAENIINHKSFDVKPYIKGSWYGQLADEAYFKSVTTDGYTVVWPDGQDLCPDELYELSVQTGD